MAFSNNSLVNLYFAFKDDVFRLFVSQLLCYLLAIVYNLFLVKKDAQIKHYFNVFFGLAICYYNFGSGIIHSVVTCLAVWSAIRLLGPTSKMVILNFAFTMAYLLYGYFDKDSGQVANFTWTLPQCVLTLSLTALSFDIYDGRQNAIAKKTDAVVTNEDTALEETPTLLEILSRVYFPPSFLIGPQIRFKDYINFINSQENLLPYCFKQSVLRFVLGLAYFGFYQLGQTYFPVGYFISDQFKSHNLIYKLTLLAIANKATLCKYISGWLISEGGCIMYGISRDPKTGLMERCFNMNLLHYETTATLGGLIESFNMSTNSFALRYVFKRLKFLKSKLASQFITLFFLALWHGYALGYYNTFAMEMVMMKMEKDLASVVVKYRTRNQRVNRLLNTSSLRCLIYILMRLHVLYMFSYAFTSFGFLQLQEWISILSQVHYIGHYIYFSWLFISILIGL